MKRIIGIILILISFTFEILAQDIKKDVTVVKQYEPVVQDFSKINLLPAFNDTSTINPVFEYKITPVKMDLSFQPKPVPAAKMAQEPIKRLYNNYIKLGYGNPFSPLVEVSASTGRSKENSAGVFLRHHSANGKVKLNSSTSVDAPYSDNEIDVYGKHLFKKSELYGDITYTNNQTTFYGIDPAINKVYDKKDYDQNYQKAGFLVHYDSNDNDSSSLIYNSAAGFNYLTDNYNFVENNFILSGKGGKNYKKVFAGTSVDLNYFKPGSGNDTAYNTVFSIRPFISKKSELWRFEVGLGLTFDVTNEKTNLHSYPSASFEFNVAPSVLKAFISYQGFLETNNLDKIRQENPYILPGLQVKNTNYKTHIYGGFKGSFSSSINFLAALSYSSIENQYFFINDTLTTSFHNYFQTVYDDIDKLQVTAEVDYAASQKLNISAKGNFYHYSTFQEEKPWHLPNFDLTLGLKYSLREKIILKADAYLIGERFARNIKKQVISLEPFADFNLGVEYRYSKLLSAFIQIRNFTAAKYDIWYQYPAYRFQVMGGFTYMF